MTKILLLQTRFVETRRERKIEFMRREDDEATRGFYFWIIAHVTACLNTKNIKFHSFKWETWRKIRRNQEEFLKLVRNFQLLVNSSNGSFQPSSDLTQISLKWCEISVKLSQMAIKYRFTLSAPRDCLCYFFIFFCCVYGGVAISAKYLLTQFIYYFLPSFILILSIALCLCFTRSMWHL